MFNATKDSLIAAAKTEGSLSNTLRAYQKALIPAIEMLQNELFKLSANTGIPSNLLEISCYSIKGDEEGEFLWDSLYTDNSCLTIDYSCLENAKKSLNNFIANHNFQTDVEKAANIEKVDFSLTMICAINHVLGEVPCLGSLSSIDVSADGFSIYLTKTDGNREASITLEACESAC